MPRLRRGSPAGDAEVPVIGRSLLFGAARDLQRDLLGTFERAMLEHGGQPVRFRIGPPRIGFTAEVVYRPDDARQILATNAGEYDKDVPALEEFRRFVGDGLLTSDGDRWRRDRRIVAPLFTRRRIASYVGAMAESAERLVASWPPVPAGGAEVDVREPSMQYALEVLGATVFGEDVKECETIIRESIPVLNEQVTRTALSPVRLPSWVPTRANRRAEAARQAMWDFVEDLISDRRTNGPLDGNDLLSLLLNARDPETGEGLDDRAVRDQALIFLLAGHETTGATLTFALHLLARYPEAQQRVRDELSAVVAEQAIGARDLDRLPYTTNVINEAMRLFPAGHTIVRRAREDTELCGHRVRKRQIVAVSVWALHHNPSVWPDPYRFDPDRFSSDRSDGSPDGDREDAARKLGRYSILPFGGGPRACIGQYLAMAEMIIWVATVVRAFRLESLVETPDLDVGVSLLPLGDVPCRLQATLRRPPGQGSDTK